LYITNLIAEDATPGICSPTCAVTGRWSTCTGRDVIWKTNPSSALARAQVMSALTNLVITLFRIQGVTGYTEEPAATPRIHFARSSSWTSHQAKHTSQL
jgi:hypothetical protein